VATPSADAAPKEDWVEVSVPDIVSEETFAPPKRPGQTTLPSRPGAPHPDSGYCDDW